MSERALLKVEDLEVCYGEAQALFGVSLVVHEGEFVTLLGRNGMGKTTTVSSVLGILGKRGGRVHIDGQDVSAWPSYRVARLGIGLVPEQRQVFPNLTVLENLVATARNRPGVREPWTLQRVLAMFPRLQERSNILGVHLSGGEQQMLAIGRALMTNPRLLILDEATEGLAPLVRREIWHCLQSLRSTGLAVLVIDKNIAPLMRLADQHFVLEKGRNAWQGSTQSLRQQPELLHGLLGV